MKKLDGFAEGPIGEMDWLSLYDGNAWKDRHADLDESVEIRRARDSRTADSQVVELEYERA